MPTREEQEVAEINLMAGQLRKIIRDATKRDLALTAIGVAVGNETPPAASIDKTLNAINGVARATAWTRHGTTE